jgi:hypothetical protein
MRRGDALMLFLIDPDACDRVAPSGARPATVCYFDIDISVAGAPNRRSRSLRLHP